MRDTPSGSDVGCGESRRRRAEKGQEHVDFTDRCALMASDRVADKVERHDDMRHPSHVWTDPIFASEPLERLREQYMAFVKGNALPTSRETMDKYGKTLLAFLQFLESAEEPVVVGSGTPSAGSQWVTERRESKMSGEARAKPDDSEVVGRSAMQQRYLLPVREAAFLLGIGKTKAYDMIAAGELLAVRIGSKILVRTSDLEEHVKSLESTRRTRLAKRGGRGGSQKR